MISVWELKTKIGIREKKIELEEIIQKTEKKLKALRKNSQIEQNGG